MNIEEIKSEDKLLLDESLIESNGHDSILQTFSQKEKEDNNVLKDKKEGQHNSTDNYSL